MKQYCRKHIIAILKEKCFLQLNYITISSNSKMNNEDKNEYNPPNSLIPILPTFQILSFIFLAFSYWLYSFSKNSLVSFKQVCLVDLCSFCTCQILVPWTSFNRYILIFHDRLLH